MRIGWTSKDHTHSHIATDTYAGIRRSVCAECGHVRITPVDEPLLPSVVPAKGSETLFRPGLASLDRFVAGVA